jgi:bacterioferritin-associated ferredoxin
MYVCLCVGVTTQSVADAVTAGAVRAIIDAKRAAAANAQDRDAGNR